MQKKTAVDNTTVEILKRIKKIYDVYEEDANQDTDQNRRKMGGNMQKRQNQTMSSIVNLQRQISDIEAEMNKHSRLNEQELKKYPRLIKQCWQDIQTIVKRKSLRFKVNNTLEDLIKRTREELTQIKKQLAQVQQTKFCGCFGIDGAESFKLVMDKFVTTASQWRILAQLEPKDGVVTFKSPEFHSKDFDFIREILMKAWPQNTVKQITKVVQKYNPGKPNRLAQANQYIYGINRQQNPAYGLKIYHEQADNNDDAAACAYLGQVYQEGVLLPKNIEKAKKYYQKAISKHELYACYRYGIGLIKGQIQQGQINRRMIQEGVNLLKKAAFPDNQIPIPEALVEMGELYERGTFLTDKKQAYKVPVDVKKAIDCYVKAKQMNVPRASNNLGVIFINKKDFLGYELNPTGKLKNQQTSYTNIQKGMKFLDQAQKLGYPQAYYNIGHVYQNGILGRKNLQQALISYYKGGLKGDTLCRLKFAYQLMNQTTIMKEHYEDHYRIAYRWLDNIVHKINILEETSPLSSKIGSSNTSQQKAQALFYLGLMYEYGFGVDKSPKKAFYYYSQSAEMDYSVAKNKIGDCYFSGFGVKEDRKLAIGCYVDAANKKNSDAMVNLGTVHLNGIPGIIQRNYNLAYKYFIQAIEAQNSNAMIHLSYMYKNALGLQSDRDMARKLLTESAASKNPTALYMLKQMGGQFDEKTLFHNIDAQVFATPRRINVNQIVPYIDNVKI